jgi:hypothetical protein
MEQTLERSFMRHRSVVALAIALGFTLHSSAVAQAPNPRNDGLVRGDYVRVSFTSITPVSPSGSLKEWKRGNGVNVMWENWDNANNGEVGIVGFGLYGDVGLLSFDQDQFIEDFVSPVGIVRSASSSRARVIQIGVNTRLRLPVPYIMPSISFGFGFLDWHPGTITYQADSAGVVKPHQAKQQNRQGGVVSLVAGLDKHIYSRYAIFGEAAYAYGFTSFGQGLGASGSQCVTSNCDLLKNTPFGSIRGGLRVRTGR